MHTVGHIAAGSRYKCSGERSFITHFGAAISRPPDKSVYQKVIFLISQPKHMLWVLKRTVSMRRFI